MLTAPNGKPMVLLFNTATDASRAARLHVADCPMVNVTGRGRNKPTKLNADIDQDDIDDLNERGYPVKQCKCCR